MHEAVGCADGCRLLQAVLLGSAGPDAMCVLVAVAAAVVVAGLIEA